MILNSNSTKPIYVQISEWLETEILSGRLKPHDKVYSQYQLADMFNINPATAAKGLTILAEEDILYKKRGLGMFVTEAAQAIVLNKRKNHTLKPLIQDLVLEAKRLQVTEADLIDMIKAASSEREGQDK